jgi:transposase
MDDESEPEKKLRVTFVHPNGRREFDPVSKERLIVSCLVPGVSISRLALDHGVNANLLRKWVDKYRTGQRRKLAPSSAFVPVVETTGGETSGRGSAPAVLRSNRSPAQVEGGDIDALPSQAKVKACLPNGVNLTVDCGDAPMVVAIIEALSNVPSGR